MIAVKVCDQILINPGDMFTALGDCEAVFVIAPDRTTAYEAFASEDVPEGGSSNNKGAVFAREEQQEFQVNLFPYIIAPHTDRITVEEMSR
jgi:hypothetical protein